MAIGLVLDGGGAKGAYQIGVWKALRETGLDKNVKYIAGSSVGGLNAALFVQGDYEKAEYIWLHKLKELEGLSVLRLQMIVDKLLRDPNTLDTSVFSTSPIECYMATYCKDLYPNALPKIEYTNGRIRKYTEGQVNLRNCEKSQCDEIIRDCSIRKTVMLATSALPLLCKSHKIDGAYHRDGGIKDNSPVKPSVYAEQCKEIFVIHLDAMKENENSTTHCQSFLIGILLPLVHYDIRYRPNYKHILLDPNCNRLHLCIHIRLNHNYSSISAYYSPPNEIILSCQSFNSFTSFFKGDESGQLT